MNLKVEHYSSILSFQTSLILIDLAINVSPLLSRKYYGLPLIIFIIHCICLIITLATIIITFFATVPLQVGFLTLLYNKFRLTLIIYIIYLILNVIFHLYLIQMQVNNFLQFDWSPQLYTFFVLERLITPFFYYYYKRTILHTEDPSFYEDVAWSNKCLNNIK